MVSESVSIRARKISSTFKTKHLDNFRGWRDRMKENGKIISSYPSFQKSAVLAEYIGVILGDGNISKFPRTERLIIVGNANNQGFIQRYTDFTVRIFDKNPTVSKLKDVNAIRISIYQKNISKRLKIPIGNKKEFKFQIPKWIRNNNFF